MKRNIPPLNALRVFEVAAKTESFSKTAEMLFVTQSAVSKQIRLLEEHLGVILFKRQGGSVALSDEGNRYLEKISGALDSIESASEEFYRIQEQEVLNVDLMPSMSALWMFPRVEKFHDLYPSITLNIDSADDDIDWTKKRGDLAIRCLRQPIKSAYNKRLLDENLLIIASPKLLQQRPINIPEDLYEHKLLNSKNRPTLWKEVFARYQLDSSRINNGFSCEHFYMLIQATLQGFGLALAPSFLCRELIEEGQLISPLELYFESDYGYYLIAPHHKKNESRVIKFSQWITQELSENKKE